MPLVLGLTPTLPSRLSDAALDVFLFPAVVGGGRGDVEEVLTLGRHLRAAGFRPVVYREGGRPLPPHVEEYLEGSGLPTSTECKPRNERALTVSASWGITAGPATRGALGRPGAWATESRRVEETYGQRNVLQVSVEEFGRTFTSREQTFERYREAGRPVRAIRAWLRSPDARAEIRQFREAYRRFRAFGTANVLHLYASFRPSPGFQREYPEAIQTGPLSPSWPAPNRRSRRRRRNPREWLWYASPGSSSRLAGALDRGLATVSIPVTVFVRTPRRTNSDLPATGRFRPLPTLGEPEWHRRFRAADVRIVTGSRTLIEALALGRPFLYFNGVIGNGASTRIHRPEKLRRLLVHWSASGVAVRYRRDLSAFARLRNTSEIVRRAASDPRWGREFPRVALASGYAPEFGRLERVMLRAARGLAAGRASSTAIVRELRGEGRNAVLARASDRVFNP